LTEFLALDRIDPWGPERADFRMARICGAVSGAFGGKVPEKDYLFGFCEDRSEDDGDQIDRFRRWAEASQSWEDE
jgi:hypothetical protein